ncbi:nuclear pore glycoprotein p62-like [Metopolophium dirhodum]|uniref:nuclear pore glycoprotein p62-like n=1 Tax=Metopolophium dirhodum TaxID=44670 RepID=UPI00298FB091|nr:nuclear pore glycoprotein p62-like [Metopolophium dirhodum]
MFNKSSFNFGTPKTTNQTSVLTMTTPANTLWSSTQASAGFSLGSNTQPTFTGFSLGGTTQASTGFSLDKTTQASPGFSFGVTNQPSTAFSLGKTSASTGFLLGTTRVSNAVSLGRNQTSTVFSLGATPTFSTGYSLASTTQASTGFSLGGTTQVSTGFSLGTTSASTGFSLGTTQAPNTISLGRYQTSTAFSLGATPTVSTGFSLASTTQASTSFSLAGTTQASTGLSMGAKQASTGFSLATTKVSTGFSLGKSSAVPTGFLSGTTSTPGFSLSSSGKTTAQATTIQTIPAITTKAPPVTSQLDSQSSAVQQTNFQQLIDLINNWTVSLENQEKQFIKQANEITVWDNILTNQSAKLVKMYDILEQKEKEQVDIENELDFLLSQQKELEDCLIPIEQELQSCEVLSSLNNEREPIYKAAQEIDSQVKLLSGDIKEIVNSLNRANSKKDSDDDLNSICRILNCHMTALQYIEHNAENLSSMVSEMNEEHSRFFTAVNDNSLSSFRK